MSTQVTKTDIRRKKAIEQVLYLPADEDQAERLAAAEQRLNLSMFAGDDEGIEKAKANLQAMRDEVLEKGLVLTFRSVGRARFDEILLEHPPTEAQVENDKGLPEGERHTFDPETFWPALLADTVVGDLTAEDWYVEVFQSSQWNAAELKLLRDNAQAVNTQTRVADLGN